MSSGSARDKRRERADQAYQLQYEAGVSGAVRYTGIGIGAVAIAHYAWPTFRRQTLPFKAFLVSAFTMYGLVVCADSALLKHESGQRRAEAKLRREARVQLARQGIVATETEIAKWTEEREKTQRFG